MAQERMQKFIDLRHIEQIFKVRDWVYLCLQPYKQSKVAQSQSMKFAPRFYSPNRIIGSIGTVAYRLEFPSDAKIHAIFHISCLEEIGGKKPFGANAAAY